MQAFGMYRSNASADLEVIEDNGGGALGVVVVDSSHITISAGVTTDNLLLLRNGVAQRPGAGNDYTLSGTTITLAVPIDPTNPLDYVYAYAIGGS